MKYPERIRQILERVPTKIRLPNLNKRAFSKREVSRKLLKRYFRLLR
jgi:type IV secretory pathway VirB4 component